MYKTGTDENPEIHGAFDASFLIRCHPFSFSISLSHFNFRKLVSKETKKEDADTKIELEKVLAPGDANDLIEPVAAKQEEVINQNQIKSSKITSVKC